MVDRIYIISCDDEVAINKCFTTQSISPVVVTYQYVPVNELTNGALKHLGLISDMTEDNFDWKYYSQKYCGCNRNSAWSHWNSNKLNNPINNRTITSKSQITDTIIYLHILRDTFTHNYKKILIVNINTCTELKLSPDFHEMLKKTPVTSVGIFLHKNISFGYCIDMTVVQHLFVELSYFIRPIDEILLNYNPMTFNVGVDLHEKVVLHLNNTLNIIDYRSIIDARDKFLLIVYDEFIKKYDLSGSQINQINHITHTYPYSHIKYDCNKHLCLDYETYLYLCLNLHNFDYFQKINVKMLSEKITDCKTIFFDHDFYLKIYPCYKELFSNAKESYTHYISHGIKEKLMPNDTIFKLIKCCQDYNLKLMLSEIRLPEKNMNCPDDPIIYILTRTCNREKLFGQCVESIISQKYHNLRHIVSYDNQQTLDYVNKYSHIHSIINLTQHKGKLHPNQYIDCFYEYLRGKEDGWVIVIDDDDKFMTDNALRYLKPLLSDTKTMIIWMLYRPDKFIYPTNKHAPVVGEIGSCCYIYHTSVIQKGYWLPNGIGDFTFFKHTFGKVKTHKYVDLPLTGVNYVEDISGWTAS